MRVMLAHTENVKVILSGVLKVWRSRCIFWVYACVFSVPAGSLLQSSPECIDVCPHCVPHERRATIMVYCKTSTWHHSVAFLLHTTWSNCVNRSSLCSKTFLTTSHMCRQDELSLAHIDDKSCAVCPFSLRTTACCSSRCGRASEPDLQPSVVLLCQHDVKHLCCPIDADPAAVCVGLVCQKVFPIRATKVFSN